MEKSRAIDLLDNLIGMIEDNQDNDYDTAFRMAIEALKAQLSQEGTTKDAISRQAAIDAMCSACGYDCDKSEFVYNAPQDEQIILCPEHYALASLPSAQPERQKGEWIDYTEDGYVECPFCHSATNCDGNKDELHFCFSCGADMRGEPNE